MTTLSSKKIAALKPREKRYSIADGNGLTLRVMPSGKKIWYLRTSSSSRVADKKLGEYPDMNLAQARQKARRLRKDIGLEPPKGYVLKDAFRLWCRLKKPQIVSYQDEHMKKRRPFRVPLTTFMKELIAREQELSPRPRSSHVFAGKCTGKHMSSQALAKYLHSTSLKGRLVAHGLRSIARSWLADEAVPFDVAEMCLSHDVGTQVSRAYQRSDFFDARRAVMERWSEHVRACAESAGIIDWK